MKRYLVTYWNSEGEIDSREICLAVDEKANEVIFKNKVNLTIKLSKTYVVKIFSWSLIEE